MSVPRSASLEGKKYVELLNDIRENKIMTDFRRKQHSKEVQIKKEKNAKALHYLMRLFSEKFPEHNFTEVYDRWKKNKCMRDAHLAHYDIRSYLERNNIIYEEEYFVEIQEKLRKFLSE